MREKVLKTAGIISKLVILVSVGALFSVVFTHLFGITGLALAAVGGVIIPGANSDSHTVRQQVPELDLASVASEVAKFNPSRYVMDTLFRNGQLGAKGDIQKAKSLVKRFYGFHNLMLSDTLDATGSTNENDGTTSGTAVKSYTYTTGTGYASKWLKVSNADKWTVDTLFVMRDLMVNPSGIVSASGLTKKVDVVFFVEDVANGAIKAKPIMGILGTGALSSTYVWPNFSATAILYKIGTAKDDRALTDTAVSYYPTPDINYCQYFIRTVSESMFQKMQEKEVEWDIKDMLNIAIYNLRAEIEGALLWGEKAEVINNGRLRYTMRGLTRFINQQITYTNSGITKNDMINLFKTAFTGNSGSANKLLVAGADYLSKVMAFMLDNTTYMRTTTKVDWGIVMKQWETDFGIINVVHHPLLTEHGRSDYGYLFDMEYVHKAEFQPFSIKPHDLVSAAISNEIVYSISEVSTCFLDNPDCHFAIVPA